VWAHIQALHLISRGLMGIDRGFCMIPYYVKIKVNTIR